MSNIQLIDDDEKLCSLVKDYLNKHNHDVTFYTNVKRGLDGIKVGKPDLVLLDVMLPDMNGFEVLKLIRKEYPNLPVIMLTARGEPFDRVLGLELGADDYIPKPYEPRELLARITSVMRRSRNSSESITTDSNSPLKVDESRYIATLNDETLDLTSAEFEVLLTLVKSKGKIISRDDIIEGLHGSEWASFSRGIDVLISRLRNKLNDDPKNPNFIKTIRGKGYKFIG